MTYGLSVTDPPTLEPVTLAQAKAHLRIGHSDDDAAISAAISAARLLCEQYSGRYFLEQTVRLKLGGWPSGGLILLTMFGPNDVKSIEGFTYLDSNGDEQEVAEADYQAEFSTSPPEIYPGVTVGDWPSVESGRRWPITLDLTVGVDDTADLDARIPQAVLLVLAYWDRNRGDEDLATAVSTGGLPIGAKRLLNSIWSGAYG